MPTRFQVDFQCGCSLYPRPDIAIHFNPRLHTAKPHVICNTLYLERWQTEARWPHVDLQRGASFLLLFLFGNEEMKVGGRDGPRCLEPARHSFFLCLDALCHCVEGHCREGQAAAKLSSKLHWARMAARKPCHAWPWGGPYCHGHGEDLKSACNVQGHPESSPHCG